MIATGVGRCAVGACPQAHVTHPTTVGAGAVGLFVLLRAFASGAAALTGVEAISNGVSAFRSPKATNAARTLAIMGAIAIGLFLGVSYLAVQMHARPSESVSVLSEVARATFPSSSATSAMYYVVQGLTFGILVLAANTSYQGFPRLAAVLAHDGFAPRQFVNLGDRLVYSNGIVVLAAIASVLIWVFHADVISLIHLYVVGVFTAFTLSQAGMVRRWLRSRSPGWQRSAAVNGVGAVVTGVVTLLVIQAKFLEGAWMVIVAIPVLVSLFLVIRHHYGIVGRRLRAETAAVRVAAPATNTVVVWLENADAATRAALRYAWQVAGESVHVVRPEHDGRSAVDTVRDFIWTLPRGESSFVTVVVPELFDHASLGDAIVRSRSTFALKLRLLSEPGVVVTDVPLVRSAHEPESHRYSCRVLVSGVQAASLRAVHYAQSLGLEDTRAVYFAFDPEGAARVRLDWAREELSVPLEVVEAPYRDLGEPLLGYLREVATEPGDVCSVVMPELVFSGWRRLLHNQRALYIKRLLLFEPRVVLSSVPYQFR
jgi:hypothetical protein